MKRAPRANGWKRAPKDKLPDHIAEAWECPRPDGRVAWVDRAKGRMPSGCGWYWAVYPKKGWVPLADDYVDTREEAEQKALSWKK